MQIIGDRGEVFGFEGLVPCSSVSICNLDNYFLDDSLAGGQRRTKKKHNNEKKLNAQK